MSYEDRVRLVLLVDTALAMSSLEVGVQPQLSFDLYTEGRATTGDTAQMVYQVNHNDAGLFEGGATTLIEDPEIRALLAGALTELAVPHNAFLRQMLDPENSELDDQLSQRGLVGRGLDLKEGGQRKAIREYREATTWLSRRKWFRSALKWTDIVLGSLSSVPGLGVAVDPLKEWKEAVEVQLDVESGRRRKK